MIEQGTLTFDRLEVGRKVKAWVRQYDTRWGQNRWLWKAEILEKKTIENAVFGQMEVFVIKQEMYTDEWAYGSDLVTYYAPKIGFIVFWRYTDSNKFKEECHLVSQK